MSTFRVARAHRSHFRGQNGEVDVERGVREAQLWKGSARICCHCDSMEERGMRPGLALDKKGNNHVQASEQAIDAKYSNFLLIPSMMHCGRQLADLYDS